MPFFDKHWRLRWVGAVVSASFAVFLPIRHLQVAVVWNRLRGLDMTPDLIFAICASLLLCLGALWLWRGAKGAAARMEWRTAFIQGRRPAGTQQQKARTPSRRAAPRPPLTIVRSISILARIGSWLYLLLAFPCTIITILLWGFTIAYLIAPDIALWFDVRPFLLTLVAGGMTLGTWIFWEQTPDAFRRAGRYVADRDGLSWKPVRGLPRRILWRDARLLEKIAHVVPDRYGGRTETRHLLYSVDTVIQIDHVPDWSREHTNLITEIERRSGLTPYTLSWRGTVTAVPRADMTRSRLRRWTRRTGVSHG